MPPCWRVASVAAVAIATLAAPCAAQQQAAAAEASLASVFPSVAQASAFLRGAAGQAVVVELAAVERHEALVVVAIWLGRSLMFIPKPSGIDGTPF